MIIYFFLFSLHLQRSTRKTTINLLQIYIYIFFLISIFHHVKHRIARYAYWFQKWRMSQARIKRKWKKIMKMCTAHNVKVLYFKCIAQICVWHFIMKWMTKKKNDSIIIFETFLEMTFHLEMQLKLVSTYICIQ